MKKGLGRGLESLFSIYDEDENNNIEDKKENIKDTNTENEQVGNVQVDNSQKENTQVEIKQNISQNVSNASNVQEYRNQSGVAEINMKQIDPNKNQPRKTFDAESLKELSESIKLHGVIQPIIVNDENNGRYTIIAGERRFRASLVAGKTTIPAIIRQYSPKQVKEIALIENLQREDLNPIEAAKAIKELMLEYDFTQETVADRIGKSRSLVANTLRLLSLTPEVVEMIEKGKISAGHGKCLVVVEDKQKQVEIANIVVENKLTVRDLENYIKNYQNPKSNQEKASIVKERPVQSIELKELGHRIARLFKTKVKINGDDKKGKIVIDYYNVDDLDRICTFINSLERQK